MRQEFFYDVNVAEVFVYDDAIFVMLPYDDIAGYTALCIVSSIGEIGEWECGESYTFHDFTQCKIIEKRDLKKWIN